MSRGIAGHQEGQETRGPHGEKKNFLQEERAFISLVRSGGGGWQQGKFVRHYRGVWRVEKKRLRGEGEVWAYATRM